MNRYTLVGQYSRQTYSTPVAAAEGELSDWRNRLQRIKDIVEANKAATHELIKTELPFVEQQVRVWELAVEALKRA